MYFEHFKKEISKEEAYDKAIKLIEFVEVVCQPITEEDLLKVEESRKQLYRDKNNEKGEEMM